MKSYGYHQVKENASQFIWNFSLKFDVESCLMPRLDSRPLETRIDSIGFPRLYLRETYKRQLWCVV